MPTHPTPERMRAIKTLSQLVTYLREELEWPIESDDIEDISFDYTAAELGLAKEPGAWIKEIKQLRPLSGNQPWGIFWVDFEKKRIPVTIMRLILRALVLKKRDASNAAERQAWQTRDLLFISAYGEDSERAVTFAHFVENPGNNLAELRVLGWDDDDTPLHMDYVARMLGEKLRWDDKLVAQADKWRERWAEAFIIPHRHVVRTSAELAAALATLARRIRSRIRTVLRYEDGFGEMRKLQRAFQNGLIHDLDDDGFSDMFAQTVTYGLFSVACRRTVPGEGTAFTKDDLPHYFTSPFLKEMLGVFLGIKTRQGAIDFDELGVSDVTDLLTSPDTHMEVVLADFNNKTRGEDPVIHFYEHFLSAYNKALKVQRGVFYTPQPVVSYIVRSVHELLQTEFGLEHGLADTTTWGEMIARSAKDAAKDSPSPGGLSVVGNDGKEFTVGEGRKAEQAGASESLGRGEGGRVLKLPPLTDEPGETRTISPDEMFVQILDPATGTATFLVEVIDVIHKHLKAKWDRGGVTAMPRLPSLAGAGEGGRRPGEGGGAHNTSFVAWWNEYVPKALLPRLHAYELMMAPYAIAHMKVGLKLAETGYTFEREERARIYLTNALEPKVKQLPQIGFDALAHEAAAVNEIKWYKRFTVVIGNPPYSNFGQLNKNPFILGLLENYKRGLDEKKLNLDDDFIKFVRFSQHLLSQSALGVLGFITNNVYADGVTHRRMRQSLLETFKKIRLLDLHGSSKRLEQAPGGGKDENVFDITVGVSIGIFSQCLPSEEGRSVVHGELWGERAAKYAALQRSICKTNWQVVAATAPHFFFVPKDFDQRVEYERGFPVQEVFPLFSSGIQTKRDNVAVAETKEALLNTLKEFAYLSPSEVRSRYGLPEDGRDWTIAWASSHAKEILKSPDTISPILYRPFDSRWTVSDRRSKGFVAYPRFEVMSQMRKKNLGLVVTRQLSLSSFQHVFATRQLIDGNTISLQTREYNYLFPLYLSGATASQRSLSLDGHRKLNLGSSFLRAFASVLGCRAEPDGLPIGFTPEDIFHYTYAVFHSPGYRSRYSEFLKIDFPRLPLPGSLELFRALARLGGELTAFHLLEEPKLDQLVTELVGIRSTDSIIVEKPSWSEDAVWIDKAQTVGFRGVPENVWNFHIGGYQVCAKWLKDRKGRTLTADDLKHYQKIVVALSETIRLMSAIDCEIEKHGGWPSAFASPQSPTVQPASAGSPISPSPQPPPEQPPSFL